MLATERKLPVSGGAEKRTYVRGIFTAIAPRYDLLNHVLSLNLDRLWRRRAVALLGWERCPDGRYLDLCAGTMDLAAALAKQPQFSGRVTGADFVQPMLQLGRHKAERTDPVVADALELPFIDHSFDGGMIGFGLRNLSDPDTGLEEAARVLKPGARFVILEFSQPRVPPLSWLFWLYFRHILPRIGRLVSKHMTAYSWLPASVAVFPGADALSERMNAHGFRDVRYELLLGGVCALHVGVRR